MEHLNTSSEPDIENDSSYWMSIGDLMSGLMFIFILALSVFMINITELEEKLEGNREVRKEILEQIDAKMEDRGFTEIIINDSQDILRLKEGILFNSGEAKLQPRGRELLNNLGPVTLEVLTQEKYQGEVETIFIEGHTDSLRVGEYNKFQTNWDLSTQRAINTWVFMRASKDSLKDLKNKDGEPIFSVSGYADSRPVATNKTKEGRRKNRRIDFRFNMVTPETDDGPADDVKKGMR
jgi:flagellar motor protein MotB